MHQHFGDTVLTALKYGIISPFMSKTIRDKLSQAALKILRPLVRMLIKNGISHAEFSELGRRAYVEVGFNDFRIDGRKQTVSRVAVLTGLSRKEVLRISQESGDSLLLDSGTINRALRVINGWMNDSQFHDEDGHPLALPLQGARSFSSLVKNYSGDITAGAILDELVRTGAVKKENELIALTAQGYIPQQCKSEKIDIAGICATDLLNTLDHNLDREGNEGKFQRAVAYHNLPDDIVDEFKALSREKGTELLIELNAWLSAKKTSRAPLEPGQGKRIGLGIYYFEDEPDEGKKNERK